jgi:signal transduction histidine kinase
MAITKWLQYPGYDAAPELLKSLTIRKQQHNTWGENSSYAHLADFYEHSRPDSALWYAHKMFTVAVQLRSPYDQLGALQKLIVLSSPADVKKYFRLYQSLSDSLEAKRNAAKNQFALIRYNVEKAKADNLKLQKDNSDANYQIIRQKLLIGGILLLFAVMIFALYFWYRKSKEQQLEHTRAMVKETEQRASKKVHDTLGNDIYAIMNKVEHDDVPNKEWLIDNINDVYQRARNLSHQITLGADEDFHEKLSQRLKSFGTTDTRVSLVGNSPELWKKFAPLSKFELYYILQELMVNMRKHSRATNVVIKFEDQGYKCLITYSDNGIGISANISGGNGMRNTGNRIKSIRGEITFDSSNQKGLQIQISLPIA